MTGYIPYQESVNLTADHIGYTVEKEEDMTKLNDEQNLLFMNNKERIEADNRLKKAIKRIEEIKTLSAQTILTLMPQALKELSDA